MPEEAFFDVVITGGGPAGAASAVTLANFGCRVLLLEKQDAVDFKIGESLPPAGNLLLRDLGVWEKFLSSRKHLPCYGNQSAWGSDTLDETDFIFDPNGHGWHLDRPAFDRFLRERAQIAGAQILSAAVNRIDFRNRADGYVWSLQIKDENNKKEIYCRWLIDASGRQRAVARRLNVAHRVLDKLVGCYAVFKQSATASPAEKDSRTLIEAAPNGWWYTALLPQKERVFAYMTDSDLLPDSEKTDERFQSLIGESVHIRKIIEKYSYRLKSKPRIVAAHSTRLDNFCGRQWLAVGDAAFSCDPLSSQGIMTALFTGMKGGEFIHQALAGNSFETTGFQEQLERVYNAYLQNLASFYNLEKRWSQNPFWQRRHNLTNFL